MRILLRPGHAPGWRDCRRSGRPCSHRRRQCTELGRPDLNGYGLSIPPIPHLTPDALVGEGQLASPALDEIAVLDSLLSRVAFRWPCSGEIWQVIGKRQEVNQQSRCFRVRVCHKILTQPEYSAAEVDQIGAV